MGGSLSRVGHRILDGALVWLPGIALGVAVLPPLLGPALDLHVSRALFEAVPVRLFLRSLLTAGLVTALAVLVGVAAGLGWKRARLPFRRSLLACHAVGLVLPPFFSALGWMHWLGQEGFVGSEASSRWLFSEAGVVLVLAGCFAPVATGLTILGLDGLDPSLEEAARVVGGPAFIVRRVLLPLLRPVITLSALIVFSLAFFELSVPMFLRVDAYPAAVMTRLAGFDYAPQEAAGLAVLPVGLAAVMWTLARRALSRARLGSLRPRSLDPWLSGGLSRASSVLWVALAIMGVAPLLSVVLEARSANLSEVVSSGAASLGVSLALATLVAVIAGFIGICIGPGLARAGRSAAVLDGLATLGFVAPAALLGAGMVRAWNRPGLEVIYGGLGLLVLLLVARYSVLAIRTIAVAVAQSSATLEDAAAIAGGGPWFRLVRVVVHLHWRAMFGAAGLVALFALRDLDAAVLVYPPGLEPLTVRIFILEPNGPPGLVAALAILLAAPILAVGGALARILGRGEP